MVISLQEVSYHLWWRVGRLVLRALIEVFRWRVPRRDAFSKAGHRLP